MTTVYLPIRIQSTANLRECWQAKARRAKTQRMTAFMAMHGTERPALPVTITLTRIGAKALDSDNLAAGFKAVRDGVADWLGIDDGSPLVTWRYEQRRGKPREYAAEVSWGLM